MRAVCIFFFCLQIAVRTAAQSPSVVYKDENQPVDKRVSDLLSRLSVEEKVSLLGYDAKGVPRLGIPTYNWWNEALHGVARAGEATVFPQAIGMAASFDAPLLEEIASVISTEARAKHNLAIEQDRRSMYTGLTFWSPNVNIFRDPRWGRGQETYGEDPFLTGTMGSAFVRGMQGNDSRYLKTAACAKHYAVHSGPEKLRHGFNVDINEKDLRETYLPAFQKLVGAGVEAVMTAYNSVNGEPCSINNHLIKDILRKEWKFGGHVVTDCGALHDIWKYHKTFEDRAIVAAEAIKRGINVDCSNLLQSDALQAYQKKLISDPDIDKALAPSLRTQFKLGFFDQTTPFSHYGADSIANEYHISLSRRMARESMVLLKNEGKLLPLNREKFGAYMILGPNAASLDALLGSYHGTSSRTISFVDGITRAVGKNARVEYDMGCDYKDTTRFGGIWAAGNADISIAVLGLTPVYEGEEGDAFLAENGADRLDLGIPRSHVAFLKQLREKTKTPLVLVLTAGSAIDISELEPYADAIILAWYPGQEGGNALADILFGNVSPSGRLPLSFYRSVDDLPPYEEYGMKNRTYRYFAGELQYPFGYGLSYSDFDYAWKRRPVISKEGISFSVEVRNTGAFDAGEVVQAYIEYPQEKDLPIKELKAFGRVELKKDESATVSVTISMQELCKWEGKGWKMIPGHYRLVVGSHSSDRKLVAGFRL